MTARLLRLHAALIAAMVLGACAAATPPSAPGVVATAGHDKSIADFRQDDADCRQAAAAAANQGAPAAATPQQRYDARYAHCMGAKGNRVEQALYAYPLVAAVVPPMVGVGGGGHR
jgi:hypothetical protein